MQKKVLHIIHGFGMGGAETWLLACSKFLQQHPELGYEFDYLAIGGKKEKLDDAIIATGSKIFYVKYSLKNIFAFKKNIKNLLNDNQYVAIHSHLDFVSGWIYFATINYLPPIRIAHLHNPFNFVKNYTSNYGRKLSYLFGRYLMSIYSTSITGTSNRVMDEYGYNKGTFLKKRIKPAYCGFDETVFKYDSILRTKTRESLGILKEDIVGIFVGRIGLETHDIAINQKNPEFAFHLAVKAASSHPNFKFIFVGHKGELGNKLELEIKALKLNKQIFFTGVRHDVASLMSASDFLLFPSYFEGLGMVAVEAQASGLKVLMSKMVPTEAVVISEIVHTIELNNENEKWIDLMISKNEQTRDLAYNKISNSPFSLKNSVLNLIELYEQKN